MLAGVRLQPKIVAAERAGLSGLGGAHDFALDADVGVALQRARGRVT